MQWRTRRRADGSYFKRSVLTSNNIAVRRFVERWLLLLLQTAIRRTIVIYFLEMVKRGHTPATNQTGGQGKYENTSSVCLREARACPNLPQIKLL